MKSNDGEILKLLRQQQKILKELAEDFHGLVVSLALNGAEGEEDKENDNEFNDELLFPETVGLDPVHYYSNPGGFDVAA